MKCKKKPHLPIDLEKTSFYFGKRIKESIQQKIATICLHIPKLGWVGGGLPRKRLVDDLRLIQV